VAKSRRRFLHASAGAALAWAGPERTTPEAPRRTSIFLCGDVMTGRGIDQVLPHPSNPKLHEGYVRSALEYVELAERTNGPIPRRAAFDYVWGDALAEIEARSPDLRLVNLETSVTTSDEAYPKGINYRMHPRNAPCLRAAGIGCASLANNHVLDWGPRGLLETLDVLAREGVAVAGAGRDLTEAERPAVVATRGKGRVLVFGFGSPTSGVPAEWAAAEGRPGVSWLEDLSGRTADRVAGLVSRWRRPGDLVVASIHWGGNWGYDVPAEQREFAHRLVERGAADLVHGHSSHHPKGIEVYRERAVLYGCGDFLNDYEGIAGYEEFRSELVLACFASLDAAGRLAGLEMVPFRIRRFRLERVARADAQWLERTLDREARRLGTAVELRGDGSLALRWS
jgi:poly-gamma-glutamate synthesis protein (capsule biosynthesis protein)